MVNLNYLRYFYVCAQSGSFTKAAARLRISQPSLSIQIKSFEDQLGFHIFIRTGKVLQLTPKGQSLFLYASKIFQVTDDLEKYLKDNEPISGESLKIGVSEEVERPFVAEIVGRLIKANSAKNLRPSIISQKHDEMVQLVVDEKIDFVITNKKTSDLKLINMLSIPVRLISKNSLPAPQSLTIQNLFKMLEQDIILPAEDMILTNETKNFLKSVGAFIPVALTSNIIACITRSVMEGLGAAFLPVTYVQKELQLGGLSSFGPPEGYWQHNLYLYSYKDNKNHYISSLSKIMQDFGTVDLDTNKEVCLV